MIKFNRIAMDKSISFWDSVASIYEESDLTQHKSDSELNYIYEKLDQIKQLNTLVCLGAADGCRDPMKLLEHLEKSGRLPHSAILNDLSAELLKICQKRMKKYPDIDAQYASGSMEYINTKVGNSWHNKDPVWYICGVYNANYMAESLKLYQENKSVLGDKFEIKAMKFTDTISYGLTVEFGIDNFEQYIDQVNSLRECDDFVAYSISTNKNFTTHYYTEAGIVKLLKSVFTGCDFESTEMKNDRYVMVMVKKGEGSPTTLITTLNNVVGNIPDEFLFNCLNSIKKGFFSEATKDFVEISE